MDILYECTKCGETSINRNGDGLRCSKCKGALVPLGDVNQIQNNINMMKIKIENANKKHMMNKEKKQTSNLTIRVNLDITEFEKNLNRLENKLKSIKILGDMISYE